MTDQASVYEQESWYDAIYNDKDMTLKQKIYHLYHTARDYGLRLRAISKITEGLDMSYYTPGDENN